MWGEGGRCRLKPNHQGFKRGFDKEQQFLVLETMAGKGTELGRTFDELARIIDGVTLNEKLSVTLDTCHTNDAGTISKTISMGS